MQMYEIDAKPTKYAGVVFRSKLEANWAELFDAIGLAWEYEPVVIPGWMPDFRIAEKWYAEVKPVSDTRTIHESYTKAIRDFETLLLGDGPSWCFGLVVQRREVGVLAQPIFCDVQGRALVTSPEVNVEPMLWACAADWQAICNKSRSWQATGAVSERLASRCNTPIPERVVAWEDLE